MNVLIFVYSILFFILSKKRIDLAILFLIISLPSYLIRFRIFGMPMTVLELMILIVFLSWVFFHTEFFGYLRGEHGIKYFFEQKKKRISYPFGKELVALLFVSLFAALISGFSESALGLWKAYFFEPAILFVIVLNVFQGEKIKEIFWALGISSFLVSILAIWQKITGFLIFNDFWAAEGTRRAVSFFGYPNAVGLYLAPLSLLIFGFLLSDFKKLKTTKILFLFLVFFLSLSAIYFAKSEGALIGILAGLFIFGLLSGRKAAWITIVLVVVSTGFILSFPATKNYAIKKVTLNDFSGQVRRLQWSETWKMLNDGNIILGSGLANYQSAIESYHQEGFFFNSENDPDFHRKTVFNEEYRKAHWQPLEIYLYPHNLFLNFWTELGLAGMLLFVWIIGKYFYLGYKNTKQKNFLALGLVGAMVAIVVHGLVDVPYFKNDLAVMFWVLVAILSLLDLENWHRENL